MTDIPLSAPIKVAFVLDRALPSGLALNTACHLAMQLGCLVPALAGTPVADASGGRHAGLPRIANVVLAASREHITRLTHDARRAPVLLVDYPRQGFETTTDEEFTRALGAASAEELEYWALAMYGERRVVNRLTRALELWK